MFVNEPFPALRRRAAKRKDAAPPFRRARPFRVLKRLQTQKKNTLRVLALGAAADEINRLTIIHAAQLEFVPLLAWNWSFALIILCAIPLFLLLPGRSYRTNKRSTGWEQLDLSAAASSLGCNQAFYQFLDRCVSYR
jgi:hypothetical protein